MEKGNTKKLFSEPNKSRINSLTRKEKTTVRSSGFAFTHPFGWITINIMMVPQIAEKLTATDIQDSSSKKHNACEEWVQGSGVSEALTQLTAEHQAQILARRLPLPWAASNCKSFDISTATLMLNYPAQSAGIMLMSDEYGQWQFRPDEPWASKDGKKPKYDAFLAKHPEIEGYWKDLDALRARCFTINGKPYILITEGGFKGIAGCMHDIPTVALVGVTMGLTPRKKGEPDLVPALKRLAEAGFNFIIAFDSDTKPKTVKNVRRAEKRLAERLRAYGCDVLSVTGRWEPGENGELKGMDDFINHKDIEAFRAILMQAAPIGETLDTANRKTKKPPTTSETAALLAEQYGSIWKYDHQQQTWRVYSGKHWKKRDLGQFNTLLKTVLDAKNIPYPGSAYIRDVRDLLEMDLRVDKWQTWDRAQFINFSNCVLDGHKGSTLSHSSAMGFKSFLPYDYKPLESDLSDSLEALRVNCPAVYKFFHTAMKGDKRKMFKLLAIINALLKYRFFDLQMFVHLVGAPGSGKGKFARFCQKLVGEDNTTGCQLDKLSDGSTKASIMDKQLVVFPDERKPVGIDSILSLTGGDDITYRELYQKASNSRFYGGLLICSNKPIFVGDTTGLDRRLCLVQFDNPIPTEQRKHSLERELDSEIPACIAVALSLTDDAVTQAIQGKGASQIPEYQAKEWEMKVEVNSVAAFFDTELVLDPTAKTPVGKFYDAYKSFCEEGGLSKFSIVKFPRLLSDILTEEKLPVTRHQGRIAYFEGLRLRQEADTHLTRSQVLAGVDGGVSGSLAGVDVGVKPPLDMNQRELRELPPKVYEENERESKRDDYLPDKKEESKSEINTERGLPPSTPATPANPVPATNKTPAQTPSKLPQPSRPTPATKRHHKEFKVGDRVRILDSGLHHGQDGKVVAVFFGSTENNYRIALDKESHRSKEVTVTVPHSQKFPILMKL
jgi:putative DNA primase/helicase